MSLFKIFSSNIPYIISNVSFLRKYALQINHGHFSFNLFLSIILEIQPRNIQKSQLEIQNQPQKYNRGPKIIQKFLVKISIFDHVPK